MMPAPAPQAGAVLPRRAMVLAAGLGNRMRPLTATRPKPLVEVAGRTLLDWVLDQAEGAGVEEAVVNVHYLADLMEAHLATRARPRIRVSDERAGLLDSGGGVRRALDALGPGPFWVFNSDAFWLEGPRSNLTRMAAGFDERAMDILMLLAPLSASLGFDGPGDYFMDPAGRLSRRRERQVAPFAYAGALIVKPALFESVPDGPFSLNLLFDRAEAAGRLHGVRLDGLWLHVGTPAAVAEAEVAIADSTL